MTFHAHRFCVAPMMDGTDRHCRYFHRLLTKRALLYTEMVTAEAVIHGDRDRLLGYSAVEHPVALQLGGSDPKALAAAARIGAEFGYQEINLNVGCPSDRVQSGAFGACLMRTPALVADCVAAMNAAVDCLVTVKSRIGVDDQDPETVLPNFIETVAKAGCQVFIIHARKAWLQGLSPKENREIPPLDYDIVRRMKQARADLTIILNGGLETIEQCSEELDFVDGVMLGRGAYGTPGLLLDVDEALFDEPPSASNHERIDAVIDEMQSYVETMAATGVRPHHVVRHMHGLFQGTPGAKQWRRRLSIEGAATPADVLRHAYAEVKAARAKAAERQRLLDAVDGVAALD
ncbi:MAG: tRNA dihydrouridine(20/20a) synthase DusA [Pseudomonadota bacterium]